jgi:hypothetical protein
MLRPGQSTLRFVHRILLRGYYPAPVENPSILGRRALIAIKRPLKSSHFAIVFHLQREQKALETWGLWKF